MAVIIIFLLQVTERLRGANDLPKFILLTNNTEIQPQAYMPRGNFEDCTMLLPKAIELYGITLKEKSQDNKL